MNNTQLPPVVTIDGPSGVGKGTIAQLLAHQLNWHYLDSGVLYRVVAWLALQRDIQPDNHEALKNILSELDIRMRVVEKENEPFPEVHIFCNNHEITDEIRTEACSKMSSQLSVLPFIREALLSRQHQMRKLPGLVTDGRDMGTVIFPNADVKFFFLANPEERAKRRYHQLKEKGINVSLRNIREEMAERDRRDSERDVAPAKPAADAIVIDTTELSIDEVLARVLNEIRAKLNDQLDQLL